MKTRTSMLSSLAIAALATVTLNSTEALAKSGGGGGGGMRSFSAARTSPVVIRQFKTVTPTTVKKLTTTVVRDHRKTTIATTGTTVVRDHRIKKDVIVRDHRTDSKVVVRDHRNLDPIKLPGGISVTPTTPAGTTTPTGTPGGVSVTPTPGGTIHLAPGGVVVGPIKPPGGGVVVDPVHPPGGTIHLPPGGGVIVVDPLPPKNPPAPPAPPPVVDHPHSHPSVSVGLGVVAAPVAVDPPGCVYERSVRKLPGGGLQRVIVKICPDA